MFKKCYKNGSEQKKKYIISYYFHNFWRRAVKMFKNYRSISDKNFKLLTTTHSEKTYHSQFGDVLYDC